MKKVITEEGEEFYFDFSKDGYLGSIRINVYTGKIAKGKNKWFVKKDVSRKIQMKYTKISYYEFTCSWDKEFTDYPIDRVKEKINDCIATYKEKNVNSIDHNEWDGYLGSEDSRKKEVMRDQKIKDLLNGDTSKLEDFLDKG